MSLVFYLILLHAINEYVFCLFKMSFTKHQQRVSINMHAAFILLSLLALKELKSIHVCITNSNSNKNEILNSLSPIDQRLGLTSPSSSMANSLRF